MRKSCVAWVVAGMVLGLAVGAGAAPKAKLVQSEIWPGKPLSELDPFYGDYGGPFTPTGGKATDAAATVACFKKGEYRVQLFAGPRKDTPKPMAVLVGKPGGKTLTLSGKSAGGAVWQGQVADGVLTAKASGKGGGTFQLKHTVIVSPTLGAKPPAGAVVVLPYAEGKKTTLAAWEHQKWKICDDGSVQVGGGTNRTKQKFQDFDLHLEFCQPYLAGRAAGQGRGNSGVYVLDRYEVQVLDSFGLPPEFNFCGSLYRFKAPRVNMSLPPLSWQTYDITFRAARLADDGKTVRELPRITVRHNGVLVQDNVELPSPTGAAKGKGHAPRGPIQLQDHGNPVRFRNIWLVEKKAK